jgi:N-acetylglucosaminyl-diphospho-decaprenol L-rhamnosyltransferase
VNTSVFPRSPFALLLSVIVVSADSGNQLRECIGRVLASDVSLEVLLIDNASSDGVPQAIDRAYATDTRLKVTYSRTNLGFGPAVNLGAGQARGHAVMMLNPDCMVEPGDLQRLLDILADQPRAGLIGAVVVDEEGRADPASLRRDPLFRRALNTMFNRDGERINIDGDIPAEVIEAEAVSGALMLLPRTIYQRVGGFDEGYFLHCEDLDLCRRVRDLGYKVLLAGDVRVLHTKGGSSRHRPIFVSRYKHKGMWRWFRRHDPAARNPLLAAVVWTGIWSHFLLKIPGQLLRRA